ncbi:MAG: MATE family efflux transporter [Clostridiales bacterium]|nr:MATE family efflux transporter [Clostridiales bacterium]MDD7035759.1 MATE family efflux transporter [Bacillota bacterium]
MKQINILEGPLLRNILLFALPLAASSALQQLFNATDIAVVGRFAGSAAMAAVGSNGPVINLIVNIFVGLSVGANVVIANCIGQRRMDRVRKAVDTTLIIALAGGVFVAVLGFFISRPLLHLMGAPDNVIDMATLYLKIYFAGMPFMMMYNFCASILRSKGDTKRPLICLVVSGIVNVGLNLLFVALFKMGVAGVGIATVTANGVSCGMILCFLAREEEAFRIRLRGIKIHKEQLVRIARIGVPAGVQGMVFSLSNVIIQSAINGFGSDCIAGSAAAINFEYFSYFIVNAFAQAAVTFTGQNYGAGNMKRCRQVWRKCLTAGALATAAVNLAFYGGRYFLVGLFTEEPAVMEWAFIRMTHVLLFQFIANSYEVTASSMRGLGHSLLPTVLTVFGSCVLRIVWIFTVCRSYTSFETLMNIYPISWVITGTAVITAYLIIRRKEESN